MQVVIFLISLSLTLGSGLLFLMTLTYSIYLWENNKVEDLASKIKSTAGSIPSNATRSFTSVDYGNISPSSERSVVLINNQDLPRWYNNLQRLIRNSRLNFWSQLKAFYRYLLNLSDHEDENEIETDKHKDKEVSTVVDRVKNISNKQIVKRDPKLVDIVSETNTDDSPTTDANPQDDDSTVSDDTNSSNTATIGLVSTSTKSSKDMNLFEKLESKILDKLKEVGLNHYDIWIDLGQLYEKYDQNEKAKEVYALVLKHADGKEKETARNKLIGLS